MIVYVLLSFFILCQYGYGNSTEGELTEGSEIQNAADFIVSAGVIISQQSSEVNNSNKVQNGTDIIIDPESVTSQQSITVNNSSPKSELAATELISNVQNGTDIIIDPAGVISQQNDTVNNSNYKVKHQDTAKVEFTAIGKGGGGKGGGSKGGKGKGGGGTSGKVKGGGGGIRGGHIYRRPYNRSNSTGDLEDDPTFGWIFLGVVVASITGVVLNEVVKKCRNHDEIKVPSESSNL